MDVSVIGMLIIVNRREQGSIEGKIILNELDVTRNDYSVHRWVEANISCRRCRVAQKDVSSRLGIELMLVIEMELGEDFASEDEKILVPSALLVSTLNGNLSCNIEHGLQFYK